MKISGNLIIFSLIASLHRLLCTPIKVTDVSHCDSVRCRRSDIFSIEFPFHIKDKQPDACGAPGFDVHCNKFGDTIIELPPAGNFTVENIYYTSYRAKISLSDPGGCLPHKLSSIDLSKTPFRAETYVKYRLYDCPRAGPHRLDEIDCLSSLDNVIIGVRDSSISTNVSVNCIFLKTLFVPSTFSSSYDYDLRRLSQIDLTWDEPPCPSCEPPTAPPFSQSSKVRVPMTVLIIIVALVLVLTFAFLLCRRCTKPGNESANVGNNTENNIINSVADNANNNTNNTSSHAPRNFRGGAGWY